MGAVVDEGDGTSADVVFFIGVDADGFEDGGEEFARADGIFADGVAVLIGGAVDRAFLEAAAKERGAPSFGKVVASEAGVNPWGAAEFAKRTNERGLEHAALLQIIEQSRHDVIEFGNHLGVGLEVLTVAVPPSATDADEGDAGFNHAPSHEGLLSKEGRAVAIANPGRFLLDIEEGFAAHEAVDLGVGAGVALDELGVATLSKAGAEEFLEIGPVAVIDAGDGVEPGDVVRHHSIVQNHGGVAGAEKGGRGVGIAAAFGLGIERDVAGNLAIAAFEFFGNDGAEVRVDLGGLVFATAQHHLGGGPVTSVSRIERADHADFVHPLGHLRHQLGNVDAGNGGGNREIGTTGGAIGFGIPGFELAGAAGEPKQDDAFAGVLQGFVQRVFVEGMDRAGRSEQGTGPDRERVGEKGTTTDVVFAGGAEMILGIFHAGDSVVEAGLAAGDESPNELAEGFLGAVDAGGQVVSEEGEFVGGGFTGKG